VASFGVRLKQEREQRGVTLEEISNTTKIGTRMLLALEQDHFDQLPGGIFNKGFVRAYARVLGIDEEQAIADYLVASGNLPSEKEKDQRSDAGSASGFETHAESEDQQPGLPWGTFAILLLVAALGFAFWGVSSRRVQKQTRPTAPPPPPPAAVTSPAFATPPIPSPAPLSTTTSPAATPAAGQAFSVHLVLHGDSWLSVTADGRQILQGSSFSAPTEKTIRANKEVIVKAGNVGAIAFEFNGKPLPAQGRDGEVKTLTFDATGLHVPAPPTQSPTLQPRPETRN